MGGLLALGASTLAPRLVAAQLGTRNPLRTLLEASNCCALVTTERAESLWESLAGRERIVTYSELCAHRSLDGRPLPADRFLVRSLGGRADGLGQRVFGEVHPAVDQSAVVLLTDLGAGLHRITGMAAGLYPLAPDAHGVERLRAERGSRKAMATGLHGLTLDQAEAEITEVLRGR